MVCKMDIIKKIDECKLNENEKEICQWMKVHLKDIPKMSSRQLAKLTYSNPTTILRLCKKLGFENFNDLKCQIVLFIENDNQKYKIAENEDLESMNLKVSSLHKNIINKIYRELSNSQIQDIYQLVDKYLYIDFIVTDDTATLARYGADLFFQVRKICHVYTDFSKQLLFSQNVSRDHLVIFINNSKENKKFVEIARVLKRRGISTVALTLPSNQLLETYCTHTIYGVNGYDYQELKEMTFFVSFLYVFNLLTTMLKTSHDYIKM